MKCKLNSVTVSLREGEDRDYLGEGYPGMTWEQVIKHIAAVNPFWASMVIVVTNPEAK